MRSVTAERSQRGCHVLHQRVLLERAPCSGLPRSMRALHGAARLLNDVIATGHLRRKVVQHSDGQLALALADPSDSITLPQPSNRNASNLLSTHKYMHK